MRKIELSEEIKDKHLEYFEKNIVPHFDDKIDFSQVSQKEIERIFGEGNDKVTVIEKIKYEHKRFINYCKSKASTLAIGEPEELMWCISDTGNFFLIINTILKGELCLNIINGNKITYNQKLLDIFGYDKFETKSLLEYIYNYIKSEAIERYKSETTKNYKGTNYSKKLTKYVKQILSELFPNEEKIEHTSITANNIKDYIKELDINVVSSNFLKLKDTLEWNPYTFVLMSNVRVCPYCNRQYITPVYSDNGKLRADLDHFYPKIKCPYLSMSLYNLVPCCKFCNSSLKGQKEFGINDINPYEDSYDEYFKFSTNPLNFDIQVNQTAKGKSKKDSIKSYLRMFKIRELYSYHTNQAEELVEKRIIYSDSYIKELYDNNKDLFKSENEIRQLVVGYIEDKSKMNDEAFLKLRRDIAEQLHFINDNQDDKQIAELKKILVKGVN